MTQKPKQIPRQDFRFSSRLRVRWAEVDLQKIVFNAHYLMYFDTAISDYWRAMAIPYEETMHQWGGDLYVKKASVEYFASARYEDQLDVMLKCIKVGNSSVVFHGAIFRADQLLVTCELIYVYAKPNNQKLSQQAGQTSQSVPQAFRQLLTDFEAGKPMTHIKTGTWNDLGADASAVRTAVFVEEQGIPAEMEWDERDKVSLHAVAYNRLNKPLATGRLLPSESYNGKSSCKLGRVAVHRVVRGSNLGKQIMQALIEQSSVRGDQNIVIHAQKNVEYFYTKLGFKTIGEPFYEVSIQHVKMVYDLVFNSKKSS